MRVTNLCAVLTLAVTLALSLAAPASAQRWQSSRSACVGDAASAGALGLAVGALAGGLIGGLSADAVDGSGLAGLVGGFEAAAVGAWVAFPSMTALVAIDAAQVTWAWLGHLVASIVGAGIAAAGFAVASSGARFDEATFLVCDVVGALVALSGAPISTGVPGAPGRHNCVGSASRTTPAEIAFALWSR